MKEEELVELLDRGAFINTGRKPGFNREHLLFWSTSDNKPFVAIRDKLYGEVGTVLTLNYHENLAWGVDEEGVIAAKELAENPPLPVPTQETAQTHQQRPTRI